MVKESYFLIKSIFEVTLVYKTIFDGIGSHLLKCMFTTSCPQEISLESTVANWIQWMDGKSCES